MSEQTRILVPTHPSVSSKAAVHRYFVSTANSTLPLRDYELRVVQLISTSVVKRICRRVFCPSSAAVHSVRRLYDLPPPAPVDLDKLRMRIIIDSVLES